MCPSLETPRQPAVHPGQHVPYRMAVESEHGELPWMLNRREIRPYRAANVLLQHFCLNVSLRQAAAGRWHKIQTVALG